MCNRDKEQCSEVIIDYINSSTSHVFYFIEFVRLKGCANLGWFQFKIVTVSENKWTSYYLFHPTKIKAHYIKTRGNLNSRDSLV